MDATPPQTAPIGVFLLDDHEIVSIGVADLIDSEPDIQVLGQAHYAPEPVLALRRLQPEVAPHDVGRDPVNATEV